MKSILISIKPQYVAKILNGEKTIEVRKRFPKDYRGWVYIYCTKPKQKHYHLQKVVDLDNNFKEEYELDYYISFDDYSGCLETKVVARFYCDNVDMVNNYYLEAICTLSCLTNDELLKYAGGTYGKVDDLYAIHISQVEIFDKPKELSEFYKIIDIKKCDTKYCDDLYSCLSCEKARLTKAPQSWQYIEVIE